MVELETDGDHFIFKIQGLHQLWALRRRIEVPRAQVRAARLDPEAARGWWKGLRLGGTHLPGVIIAGTYYYRGLWMFFDVRRPERAVVVELEGHRFDRLVVEAEDPEQLVRSLQEGARLSQPPSGH